MMHSPPPRPLRPPRPQRLMPSRGHDHQLIWEGGRHDGETEASEKLTRGLWQQQNGKLDRVPPCLRPRRYCHRVNRASFAALSVVVHSLVTSIRSFIHSYKKKDNDTVQKHRDTYQAHNKNPMLVHMRFIAHLLRVHYVQRKTRHTTTYLLIHKEGLFSPCTLIVHTTRS
jgi:hypothetical protein